MNNKTLLAVILLTVLNVIIFLQIFPSFFFADDFSSLISMRSIEASNLIKGIYSDSIKNFFTPLPGLVFWLGYKLFGLNPSGYFIFNFLFHLANAILLYYFVLIFMQDERPAMLSAFMFVVYCTTWEALGWIGAVLHPMLAFFMLLTLIIYMKGRLFLSCATYIMAVLCHETAVVIIPAIIILYDLFIRKRNLIKTIPILSPYIVIACFFLMFKLYRELYVVRIVGIGGFTLGWHAVVNYIINLQTLIFPVSLSYRSAGDLPAYFVHAVRLIGLLIILFFPAIISYIFKGPNNRLKFLMAAILLILVPYSFLPPVSRYLYEATVFYTAFLSIIVYYMITIKGRLRSLGIFLFLCIFTVNISGMLVYQKLFYAKKEIRRQILKQIMVAAPEIKNGSRIVFIDLPIREDEFKGMIYMWYKGDKYDIKSINANNFNYKQTFDPKKDYGPGHIFVYNCAKKSLFLVKSPN